MELATALAVGLTLGALATWLLQREQLSYLRSELKVAHAQIAHAVLDQGARVPARLEEVEPLEPLTAELQACVDQWEGPENQATEEAKIRNWLGQGRDMKSILRQYGMERPDVAVRT
jgi:hypothetical protein